MQDTLQVNKRETSAGAAENFPSDDDFVKDDKNQSKQDDDKGIEMAAGEAVALNEMDGGEDEDRDKQDADIVGGQQGPVDNDFSEDKFQTSN